MAKTLGLIPARGGSLGLPRKNILPLGGRPLICWSIEAAKNSKALDYFIVSTDDEEIAKIANDEGAPVPFMRPKDIAGAETSMTDVVRHALTHFPDTEIVVLLYPTYPFRTGADIDRVVERLKGFGGGAVYTVTKVEHPPYWYKNILPDGRLEGFLKTDKVYYRRQLCPPVYRLATVVHAMYVSEVPKLDLHALSPDTRAFVIDDPVKCVDIDGELDLKMAQAFLDAGMVTEK